MCIISYFSSAVRALGSRRSRSVSSLNDTRKQSGAHSSPINPRHLGTCTGTPRRYSRTRMTTHEQWMTPDGGTIPLRVVQARSPVVTDEAPTPVVATIAHKTLTTQDTSAQPYRGQIRSGRMPWSCRPTGTQQRSPSIKTTEKPEANSALVSGARLGLDCGLTAGDTQFTVIRVH